MIELFINNQLCDVGRDFGVRLNRQLLKPGELNTKDAQFSYSITLPPTANNHVIFNYANIEETKDKFNREYKAELIINSVRVFVGLFRMSEITDKYKGNLYVPKTVSIKDVFGEEKLNEYGEYRITFGDFSEWASFYNTQAITSTPAAIFPYTLYGVLPKSPEGGVYSNHDIWDSSVRLGIQDFAPSINPLLMLQHIFRTKGYTLTGTAFNDERLTKLYMSYKNAEDYVQPWNYGYLAQASFRVAWSNIYDRNISQFDEDRSFHPERMFYENAESVNDDTTNELFACDLLNSDNSKITEFDNPGGVLYSSRNTYEGRATRNSLVSVPVSGFYKIRMQAYVRVVQGTDTVEENGIYYVSGDGTDGVEKHRIALKLLRDRKRGDFGIPSSRIDSTYFKDNQNQTPPYETSRSPFLFSRFIPGADKGSLVFVDLAQNENYVAGFQWGKRSSDDINPWYTGDNWARVNVAKPAVSWDTSRTGDIRNKIVTHNPNGYIRWTRVNPVLSRWEFTNLYQMTLLNAPENYAYRGSVTSPEGPESADEDIGTSFYKVYGSVSCVVWLEAGELLTLAAVSDKADEGRQPYNRGWLMQDVICDVHISAFRSDEGWLKIDSSGTGESGMNWNDPINFDTTSLNLVGFLPVDMKTDDFIDNICKAFNLQLTQTGTNVFELNVKQTKSTVSSRFINLDNLASVRSRSNTPLGLPSLYKLGFTVDTDEEGYYLTGDDGGGEYETGVTEEKVVEQKSSFSFNWFKNITKGNAILPLAVISKHEVWETAYPDAMKKRYPNQALRFWYPAGLLNSTFEFNNKPLSIIKVSNELQGKSILNYKNQKLTILDNYFTLLINGGSHYTEVEGYLTPEQYEDLNGSIMAMFNCDLYYVAEISGYDPTGLNKTKIKLIRKI